jgi:hypothetical protein
LIDPVAGGDLLADQPLQFRPFVGAVHAGGDEDGDALAGNAGALQLGENRRQQQQRVGDRPGDVADDDHRIALPLGHLPQRRRIDGCG